MVRFCRGDLVGGERSFEEFSARLDEHLLRLDAVGVEYRRASGPLPWQTRPGVAGRPATYEERAAYMDEVTANIVKPRSLLSE